MPVRRLRDACLYLRVWTLGAEKLLDGLLFFWFDLWFLLRHRQRIRRRIAQLIRAHGAVTG